MKNKANNKKTFFYSFGLLMLYFVLATCSCKKETKPTEVIIPTPRTTHQIQSFVLDTILKAPDESGFEWEPWDDYVIKNGEDSLFFTSLPKLDSSYHYTIENFTDVSLIMKNGDTIKNIPAQTSQLNIPSPFSYYCSCELNLKDRVNSPNYIGINWIQTAPLTRPDVNAVHILFSYWSWK